MTALYLTHGGGPLPLLGDPAHTELIRFMETVADRFPRPQAIVVVSAHWEMPQPSITGNPAPGLMYDYGGFPPESYEIRYPAAGAPGLAVQIKQRLINHGFDARLDDRRDFDHGTFVPLKLMYPEADIPCLQLSLLTSLDPAEHLRLGQALSETVEDQVLLVGSGSSFHNMRAMIGSMQGQASGRAESEEFNRWLIDTCTSAEISADQRRQRLLDWEQAPRARYCHPREEHLLPLHVCAGSAGFAPAALVFDGTLAGLSLSSFLWA